jgi:hypothetical protein
LPFNQIGVITDAVKTFPHPDSHSDRPLCPALDPSVAGSAFMRGISSPMRVTQEGPDGLSRYCPVRVICLEIQLFPHRSSVMVDKVTEAAVVGGVDTHKDLHVAVVDQNNKVLGTQYFSTTRQGYRQMLAWMTSFGTLKRIGVECTGTYGSGLLRYQS